MKTHREILEDWIEANTFELYEYNNLGFVKKSHIIKNLRKILLNNDFPRRYFHSNFFTSLKTKVTIEVGLSFTDNITVNIYTKNENNSSNS